jgi:hypothetical protein
MIVSFSACLKAFHCNFMFKFDQLEVGKAGLPPLLL